VAEFGISTFVYQRRRPFRENALDEMVEDWPKGILRCKGMVWLSEDSDMCYVFEQAGHRFSLGENGLWLATADEEYLAQLAETEPDALKGWDDEVGYREIKLVFITRGADQDAIEQWADSFLA
jgi:G3E family GTPase